jgi:hypothetical protein
MTKNIFKRATAADAKHAGALSLFVKAADELEAAASEHAAVASEAKAIADEYNARHAESISASVAATNSASRVRELVG